MNDLDRAFIQSFNDEYNKIISKVISTNENTNVDKLFKGINIPSECIICYDENVPCLKCYQCTANYCKICLTKIASDSNKCICGIDIKKNYNKIKKVNIELQENIEIEKVLAESLKDVNINKRDNTNINIKNSNVKYGGNTDWNDNSDDNYNDIIINKRIEYLSDMYNNYIYNIDFKSYINDNSPNKPNFKYEWNYDNKTLTFSPFINQSNQSNQYKNIIINYTILDARFQAELYVWLLNILNYHTNIFKSKWNSLANKINYFKSKNKNEIKKLLEEIITICNA